MHFLLKAVLVNCCGETKKKFKKINEKVFIHFGLHGKKKRCVFLKREQLFLTFQNFAKRATFS